VQALQRENEVSGKDGEREKEEENPPVSSSNVERGETKSVGAGGSAYERPRASRTERNEEAMRRRGRQVLL
jgi:hypothetical protein